MATISHLVENEIRTQPFLQEAISKRIVNFGALAEQLQPKIEVELKKKVKHSAVMMALRRLADKLEQKFSTPVLTKEFSESELNMKNNIMDITLAKSPTIFASLKKLYDIVDFEKGDFLTITQGSHEITVLVSQKYKEKFLKELKSEKILLKEENMSALSLKFDKKFLQVPGFVFVIIRELAWKEINVFEFASTMTELIFIVNKADSVVAYETLQELIESSRK